MEFLIIVTWSKAPVLNRYAVWWVYILTSFNKCLLALYKAYHIWWVGRQIKRGHGPQWPWFFAIKKWPQNTNICFKIFCNLYSIFRIYFIIANMKYYNFEWKSHLQWSDYVSGSRELLFCLCSLNTGLTGVTFPSVGALPHLHIKAS